jgi:hypothetical protein
LKITEVAEIFVLPFSMVKDVNFDKKWVGHSLDVVSTTRLVTLLASRISPKQKLVD